MSESLPPEDGKLTAREQADWDEIVAMWEITGTEPTEPDDSPDTDGTPPPDDGISAPLEPEPVSWMFTKKVEVVRLFSWDTVRVLGQSAAVGAVVFGAMHLADRYFS